MRFERAEPSRTGHYEMKLGWFDRLFVKAEGRADGFNQRMFNEDFSNIFHYSNRHSSNLFDVDTNDEKLADRLLHNVKTRYSLDRTDEQLYELVMEIAQALIWYGKAIYYLHDDDEKKETHVVSYSSESIFRVAGYVVQYLPARVERKWDSDDVELPRELLLLNPNKTLCFRLPSSTHRKIKSQNKILATLDRHHGAVPLNFQSQVTHDNPNPRTDFDFKQWRDAQDLALYKATKETGWNGRKYDFQKKSDFFDCHRLIRFRRNQLYLRDQILRQLSDELTRVGRHYRKNFRIEISTTEALPSVSHLDDLKARLSREEAGFSEVIDYCLQK